MATERLQPETASAAGNVPSPVVDLASPVTLEVRVRLQAIALREADGRFSIIVPALPGCFSAAESIEEATANVVEAAEGWLDSQHEQHRADAIRSALG